MGRSTVLASALLLGGCVQSGQPLVLPPGLSAAAAFVIERGPSFEQIVGPFSIEDGVTSEELVLSKPSGSELLLLVWTSDALAAVHPAAIAEGIELVPTNECSLDGGFEGNLLTHDLPEMVPLYRLGDDDRFEPVTSVPESLPDLAVQVRLDPTICSLQPSPKAVAFADSERPLEGVSSLLGEQFTPGALQELQTVAWIDEDRVAAGSNDAIVVFERNRPFIGDEAHVFLARSMAESTTLYPFLDPPRAERRWVFQEIKVNKAALVPEVVIGAHLVEGEGAGAPEILAYGLLVIRFPSTGAEYVATATVTEWKHESFAVGPEGDLIAVGSTGTDRVERIFYGAPNFGTTRLVKVEGQFGQQLEIRSVKFTADDRFPHIIGSSNGAVLLGDARTDDPFDVEDVHPGHERVSGLEAGERVIYAGFSDGALYRRVAENKWEQVAYYPLFDEGCFLAQGTCRSPTLSSPLISAVWIDSEDRAVLTYRSCNLPFLVKSDGCLGAIELPDLPVATVREWWVSSDAGTIGGRPRMLLTSTEGHLFEISL